mgnify:CR=1 FL=1
MTTPQQIGFLINQHITGVQYNRMVDGHIFHNKNFLAGEGRENIVARRNLEVADVSRGEVLSEYEYGEPVRPGEVMGYGVGKLFGSE